MNIVCLLTTTESWSFVKSVEEHTIMKRSRIFVHALGKIILMRCRANKKMSKIKQNCWTRNIKFVVNFQYKSFNIDRVQLPILNPETNRKHRVIQFWKADNVMNLKNKTKRDLCSNKKKIIGGGQLLILFHF